MRSSDPLSKKVAAEENVKAGINDVLAKVLGHLQNERERLISKATKLQDSGVSATTLPPITFVMSPEFENVMERLLKTPFGYVETVRCKEQPVLRAASTNPYVLALETTSSAEPRQTLSAMSNWLPPPSKTSIKESEPTRNRRRKLVVANPYEDMHVVAILQGRDLIDRITSKPTAIAAMPALNVFAVLYNYDRISLLSPEGKIRLTYVFEENPSSQTSSATALLVDSSKPHQLICVAANKLRTIASLDEALKHSSSKLVTSTVRVTADSNSFGLGLAIHEPSGVIYSAGRNGICAYSTHDWKFIDTYHFKSDRHGERSFALDVYENQLFFRGDGGTKVYAAPIGRNGSLAMNEVVSIARFNRLHTMKVDRDGMLVAIEKDRREISVWSPNGDERLTSFSAEQSRCPSFDPSDIAVLFGASEQAKNGGGGKSGNVVVACADYKTDNIVFFAPKS